MIGLPDVKNRKHRNVTDGLTDGWTDRQTYRQIVLGYYSAGIGSNVDTQ